MQSQSTIILGRPRPRPLVRGAFIHCRISDPRDARTNERQRGRAMVYVETKLDVPVLEVFCDARSGLLPRKEYDP